MSQNFCIPIVLWIQNHAKESYNHTDLTQWMGDEVQLPIKKKKKDKHKMDSSILLL